MQPLAIKVVDLTEEEEGWLRKELRALLAALT